MLVDFVGAWGEDLEHLVAGSTNFKGGNSKT